MMLSLTIWGGACEHGRSSYLLQHQDEAVLMDCGGKKESGGIYPRIDPSVACRLKTVLLSHAHEDHSMALPLLYKYGYEGVVWTSRATALRLPGYYRAWKSYAASYGLTLPYDDRDIARVRYAYLEDAGEAGDWIEAAPGVKMMWGRSGHMPGSVWYALDWCGRLIFFSGDYSEESQVLAADRPRLERAADLSIIDAACGADPDTQEDKLRALHEATGDTISRGRSVLFPVPVHGRGQELLLWAHHRFSQVPLIVDGELLAPLRELVKQRYWLREHSAEQLEALLRSPRVAVAGNNAERARLLSLTGAKLIFTAGGMMETECAQWYCRYMKNTGGGLVMLTGHLGRGSFGARLLAQEDEALQVLLVRYKVHQGLPDVRRMLAALPSHATVLVHAARTPTVELLELLQQEGHSGLYALEPGDTLVC